MLCGFADHAYVVGRLGLPIETVADLVSFGYRAIRVQCSGCGHVATSQLSNYTKYSTYSMADFEKVFGCSQCNRRAARISPISIELLQELSGSPSPPEATVSPNFDAVRFLQEQLSQAFNPAVEKRAQREALEAGHYWSDLSDGKKDIWRDHARSELQRDIMKLAGAAGLQAALAAFGLPVRF